MSVFNEYILHSRHDSSPPRDGSNTRRECQLHGHVPGSPRREYLPSIHSPYTPRQSARSILSTPRQESPFASARRDIAKWVNNPNLDHFQSSGRLKHLQFFSSGFQSELLLVFILRKWYQYVDGSGYNLGFFFILQTGFNGPKINYEGNLVSHLQFSGVLTLPDIVSGTEQTNHPLALATMIIWLTGNGLFLELYLDNKH